MQWFCTLPVILYFYIWKETQHDVFGHVKPLAPGLASKGTDNIITGTITFLVSRWSKWGATWLFGHVMPLAPVLHNAPSIINGITEFLRSGWFKWHATWHFDHVITTGTSIHITQCWWHCQWHCGISYLKEIKIKCNMIFWSCDTIGTSTGITWCKWCHQMAPLYSLC